MDGALKLRVEVGDGAVEEPVRVCGVSRERRVERDEERGDGALKLFAEPSHDVFDGGAHESLKRVVLARAAKESAHDSSGHLVDAIGFEGIGAGATERIDGAAHGSVGVAVERRGAAAERAREREGGDDEEREAARRGDDPSRASNDHGALPRGVVDDVAEADDDHAYGDGPVHHADPTRVTPTPLRVSGSRRRGHAIGALLRKALLPVRLLRKALLLRLSVRLLRKALLLWLPVRLLRKALLLWLPVRLLRKALLLRLSVGLLRRSVGLLGLSEGLLLRLSEGLLRLVLRRPRSARLSAPRRAWGRSGRLIHRAKIHERFCRRAEDRAWPLG